ncbi:MAG TPA: hypothetical protein PLF40_28090 [Kofleriaceae bacterium]|nr:hypothetical protein [Kofleriaceae bacterium]
MSLLKIWGMIWIAAIAQLMINGFSAHFEAVKAALYFSGMTLLAVHFLGKKSDSKNDVTATPPTNPPSAASSPDAQGDI